MCVFCCPLKQYFFSGFPKMAGWIFFSMKNRRKKKNIAGVFREKEMKKEKKGDVKKKKKSMTGKVMYVKWLPPSLSMMNLYEMS